MAQSIRILLIENDVNLSSVLADYLRSYKYVVDTATDGQEGWDMVSTHQYDMVLTDVVMPGMTGYELLKSLRERNNQVPVIILSSKNEREDVLLCYRLGCDDYLTKPFSMDILISKIEAIIRRYRAGIKDEMMEFNLGGVIFDGVRQTVNGKHLSSRENELLLMLCQNMNSLVERNRILMNLWGTDTYFSSRSLSVYVNHLRKYFGEDSPIRIMSVHGKGYKLVVMNTEEKK